MRIKKDGSVFRIELDSSPSEFETRISFAVNSHHDMKRPRIEVSETGLRRLFMEIVPHISGVSLVKGDYEPDYKSKAVAELVRILVEVSKNHEFVRVLHHNLADRIRALAEISVLET